MDVAGVGALVTGGASGLGRASAAALAAAGARVVLLDLPGTPGEQAAAEVGGGAVFAPADIGDTAAVERALDAAEALGPLRVLVHCAGRIRSVRAVGRDGRPGSLEDFEAVVATNLTGTFNVLRLAAARMAATEPVGPAPGERGVCVLTASVAAFEGQIGQLPYAASKAGVVGMTITAARDLASRLIRVCTIAPGTFETPMLAGLPEPVRRSLAEAVPHPQRLGDPAEYAALALHIVANPMLNGETIRLDGALRMPPR